MVVFDFYSLFFLVFPITIANLIRDWQIKCGLWPQRNRRQHQQLPKTRLRDDKSSYEDSGGNGNENDNNDDDDNVRTCCLLGINWNWIFRSYDCDCDDDCDGGSDATATTTATAAAGHLWPPYRITETTTVAASARLDRESRQISSITRTKAKLSICARKTLGAWERQRAHPRKASLDFLHFHCQLNFPLCLREL